MMCRAAPNDAAAHRAPSVASMAGDIARRDGVCLPAFLENATVRGRDWYIFLDAPVLTLDVTVPETGSLSPLTMAGDIARRDGVCHTPSLPASLAPSLPLALALSLSLSFSLQPGETGSVSPLCLPLSPRCLPAPFQCLFRGYVVGGDNSEMPLLI